MALAKLLERTGRLTGDLNRLQLRLVAYLIGRDEEARGQRRVDNFKDNLLASNPDIYYKVYGDDSKPDYDPDEDMEYREEIPQSEADVQRMMADLASLGVS